MRTIIKRLIASIFIFSRYVTGSNIQVISPRLISCPSESLRIGNDFFAGPGLYISSNKFCKIRIGSAVMFGPDVMILGGNHNYHFTGGHLRYFSKHDENSKHIVINDGVWVGARTIILSGADIGEGVIIGSNSLVNKKIPPYCLAVGSPAKPIAVRFKNVEDLKCILESVGSALSVEEVNNLLPENLKYET